MNKLISKIEYSNLKEDEKEAYLQQHFFSGDSRKLVRARLGFLTAEKASFEIISSIPPSGKEIPFMPFSDRDDAIYISLNEDMRKSLAMKNIKLNDNVSCSLIKLPQRNFRFFSIDINSITKIETARASLTNNNSEQKFLLQLQSFIKTNDGLDYDLDILRSVCIGLQTRQLIILTGAPGSGKTSLVRALARAFSSTDAEIIPVQSNWNDRSDLLGYYNPLERRYMSTPFLDALLKLHRFAHLKSHLPYFICLDEMNLTHVEYYFAEFLSILQFDKPLVELYSRNFADDIKSEADFFSQHHGDTEFSSVEAIKYYQELQRALRMLKTYPPTFVIPPNIKFFGTLNQDETTLDISPKVRDRAFFIRLYEQPKLAVDDNVVDKPHFVKPNIPIDVYETLKRQANELGVSISRRLGNVIESIKSDGSDEFSAEKIVDSLIAAFLLPKIELNRLDDEERFNRILKWKKTSPYLLSKRILEMMCDANEINYWRQ